MWHVNKIFDAKVDKYNSYVVLNLYKAKTY